MNHPESLRSKVFASNRIRHGLLGMGVIAVVGLSTWSLAIASNEAVACDVTSGASCRVLGVKTTTTGAYLLNVAYGGKTLPQPLSVDVVGSMKMANVVFPATSGIRSGFNRWNHHSSSIPGLPDYDAKGARHTSPTTRGAPAPAQNILFHMEE